MKKGLFAFVFLFVCNLFTFGVSASDFRFGRRSYSPFDAFDGFSSELLILLPIAVIVIVLLIVAIASKSKVGRNSTLILEEFSLNESEDEFLRIKGRAPGFWNWVLSLFDKAPTTSFTCNKHVLKYKTSGIKYNIPLVDITCVSSGMTKSLNVVLLFFGIIFVSSIIPLVLSVSAGILPSIIIGIVLLIFCVLSKKKLIHFGIYIGENKPIVAITMKKGIIGSIDINGFESAVSALNKAVLANKS